MKTHNGTYYISNREKQAFVPSDSTCVLLPNLPQRWFEEGYNRVKTRQNKEIKEKYRMIA